MSNVQAAPVTAVIPVYNRVHHVEQALKSVREQTLPVSEIVCVDNNSTDGSLELLQKLTPGHQPPLVVVQEPRQGVGFARNRGIVTASQPWIAFLDSDDRWLPQKTQRFFDALAQDPSLRFLASDYERERNGHREARHRSGYGGGDVYVETWFGGWIGTPTVMVHRDALAAVSGPDGAFDTTFELSEDYELWLRLTAKFPLGYLPEDLAVVVVHGHNISYANELAGRLAFLRILEKNYDPARIPAERARHRIAYIHRKCASHWRRMGERARALAHLREAAHLQPGSFKLMIERLRAWFTWPRTHESLGRHIDRELRLQRWWRPGETAQPATERP